MSTAGEPVVAARRSVTRGRAVLVVIGSAGLVLATAAPTWVRAAGSTALSAHVDVTISGTGASAAIGSAALVLLAAAGALALVGRVGRWAVVGVVVAAGVLVVVTAAGVIADPVPVATAAVSQKTGAGVLSGAVQLTAAPFVACGAGLGVVLVGVWLALVSGKWRSSSRHEAAAGSSAEPDDDHSAWDALTRGDDPT